MGRRTSSGRWRWSGILLFIPGLSAFGLGTWQIMRRDWKMELLNHRRERLKDDVIRLDFATTSSQSDSDEARRDALKHLEYRRVQCNGVFLEEKSIYLGPRGRSSHGVTERGYFLITPLVPDERQHQYVQVPVLVNRGWVPGSWRDNSSQNKAASHGGTLASTAQAMSKEDSPQLQPEAKAISLVGVIRGSENPNMFVPPNEPAKGQWFFVDVPAMACAVGLPQNIAYVEALLEDKSTTDFKVKQYPVPKDPETLIHSTVMPRDHLSYAFTWFALSAATCLMAWKRLLK